MRVVCYRNLRHHNWSIAKVTGNNGIGRVIAHERSLILANVAFVVKQPARQRVIRNRCREVHAWAAGELVDTMPSGPRTPITYNPYRAATFTTRQEAIPVHNALFVEFTATRGALAVLTREAPGDLERLPEVCVAQADSSHHLTRGSCGHATVAAPDITAGDADGDRLRKQSHRRRYQSDR